MKTTVHYEFEHEDDNRDAVTVVMALELRDAVKEYRRIAWNDGQRQAVALLDEQLRSAGVATLILE